MVASYERRDVLLTGLGGVAASLSGCAGGGTDTTSRSAAPADADGTARTDGGQTTQATSEAGDRDLRVIAHRGCADQYPENTILAVEQSAPHVDMIEVDVQRCGSGELIVFHDDDLDRLTDASGAVSTTDWETISELTVLDSDEGIPRLADLLAAVPTDTAVNLELKHAGMAADVLAITDDVDNEILYSSFSGEALRELRERDAEVALAYLVNDSPDIGRSIATDIGCVAINPSVELALETDVVERAHEDGLEVNAWTADAETVTKLRDAGVDGVIVDRWDIV
jgi:glycerophosphoryl diester phosphodiesterase